MSVHRKLSYRSNQQLRLLQLDSFTYLEFYPKYLHMSVIYRKLHRVDFSLFIQDPR